MRRVGPYATGWCSRCDRCVGVREYAAAGVPFFLRVDLRNRVPTIALFELAEGEYRPVAAAAAGTRFVMREPFEFTVDPADLLGEEAPPEDSGDEG